MQLLQQPKPQLQSSAHPDVLCPHAAVKGQALVELLHQRVGGAGEAPAPQLLGLAAGGSSSCLRLQGSRERWWVSSRLVFSCTDNTEAATKAWFAAAPPPPPLTMVVPLLAPGVICKAKRTWHVVSMLPATTQGA